MIANRRFRSFFWIFFIYILGLPNLSLSQEKVYVTDVLLINFRTGPGNDYRIEKRLKSGTELERLEFNEDKLWSKVVAPDGVEGYVLTQYLNEEPTAQLKLGRALSRLAIAENRLAQLEEQNKNLTSANQQLNDLATSTKSNSENLSVELKKVKSLSANAIDLDRRHQDLLHKHQMIQTERDTLRAENENLKSDKSLSYLIYGAGILVLGMIIAVILPYLRIKKRNSEWA